jgi:hypothetical protein
MDYGMIVFWGGLGLLFVIALVLRHFEAERMAVRFAQRSVVANEAASRALYYPEMEFPISYRLLCAAGAAA